jgi:hypothetical protein
LVLPELVDLYVDDQWIEREMLVVVVDRYGI